MTKASRVWNILRSAGHALFYVVMGGVCIAFVVMGIIAVAERNRPIYWGSFTETSTTCDPGPRGQCTSVGRWQSDSGAIVKIGVTLDGDVGRGGSVRASYQPGGPLGDDTNNIVHTATWSQAALWFPWVAAPLSAAAIWHYRRQWRRGAKRGRYRGRHAQAVDSL